MNTIPVVFHGHTLITVRQGDKIMVAMKPISDAIGLEWSAQFRRLKRDPVLSTCIAIMAIQVADDSQPREAVLLELDYLNGWLFGIDANRVKPELRDRVIEYQRECYQVLARHFRRDQSYARAEVEQRLKKAEAEYFARFPRDASIRKHVLMGQPYWYVADLVPCHISTVGKAVRRMIRWGFLEAQRIATARLGMRGYYDWLRKHRRQLALVLD